MLPLKHLFDRLRVLCLAPPTGYSFTASDYWLYLRYAEYPGSTRHFPPILVVSRDNIFVQLKIGARCYYWPSKARWDSLPWIHQEVFMPASHNPHAYEFAGARINPGEHVIDAGACEGFFVHYALGKGAKVLAVEPVPILADVLRKTFAPEISSGRVRVLPAAIGAKSGKAALDLVQERIYESKIASKGIEVPMISLDDIMESEHVDFVKMDIEGAEIDAVRGGANTIARDKPRLAIAVYHEQENARQVCQLLRQIRPDYRIRHRGIYAWGGCKPRPFMIYAW